jgi:hypothetical protein
MRLRRWLVASSNYLDAYTENVWKDDPRKAMEIEMKKMEALQMYYISTTTTGNTIPYTPYETMPMPYKSIMNKRKIAEEFLREQGLDPAKFLKPEREDIPHVDSTEDKLEKVIREAAQKMKI